MKTHQRMVFLILLGLLLASFAALLLTNRWTNPTKSSPSLSASGNQAGPVDLRPLETAERLAVLAVTSEERQYAEQAWHVADNEIDLSFTRALRQAERTPAPQTPEINELKSRMKEMEQRLETDQASVKHLEAQLAQASGNNKLDLQEDLELAKASLALDQDELTDAHQDLIRAGGDPKANVQGMLDEHEQSEAHRGGARPPASSGGNSIELTTAHNAMEQFRAWRSLEAKRKQIEEARLEATHLAENLTGEHDALAADVKKSQAMLPSGPAPTTAAGGTAPAARAPRDQKAALLRLRSLTEDQHTLAEFDKRIDDERALATTYTKWEQFVHGRERMFLHGLIAAAFWILLIAVLALVSSYSFRRFVHGVGAERKRLLTLHTLLSTSVKVLAVLLILMVIFGLPQQFATVLALAGAGLTVALKDFIVGFFGWFVLMGRNGIRPGDWVEINGVGGEVLEVGLLHTVLLETSNWSDAGHPTGRKVTFVNSFAIEGHYFNFSTSGQWLWDEIQVLIPAGTNPYPLADAIQKTVTAQTAANARVAEEEWRRVTPAHASSTFSAGPAMSLQPASLGVNVVVRYLTQASQRHEVRSRLYQSIVELLHQKQVPQAAS